MVSSVKPFLALIVLATLASTGYAIRCYEGSDLSTVVNCVEGSGCLRKSVGVGPISKTSRSCFEGKAEDACKILDGNVNLKLFKMCDFCTKDLCNGSSSLALAPVAGAIILFFGVARLLA
ncbi:UPAR/Ly6 domain-containing protein CG9338-like [Drosophila takahashii]|uniref:UPAR/Ly6 domain-containing protein CG9338-like n=1 Tax=Drosophila takahashii TaxID=29030 RepID=UPI001CF877C4|nr:uncharacterized protein LOC108064102 [Drosophila takahashii]